MVSHFFYGKDTFLLDTCCNAGVTNQKCLLSEFSKGNSKPANTLGGSYQPPYTAKSICFGDMSFDPNLPFTVLSYNQQRHICYVKPKAKDGSKFVAGFPTPHGEVIEVSFIFIDGMLIGDGSKLIKSYDRERYAYYTRNPNMSKIQKLKKTPSGKPKKTKWSSTHPDAPSELIKSQFRIITGYTDAQIAKLDLVWKLLRNSWNLSKDDLIQHLKNNTIVNTNVEAQDVVNFFKIFKFDVSKFQGTAKQISNTAPRLHLNCQISQKEIAVCGDVLEICDVYYLNMITMYGRFTMISMLSSKAAIDLVEKLIAILQKLGSYGWKVKHLVFDSEGSILSQKSEIEKRTQLKVYVYSHGNKVGLAELNNRCIRERVSTKFATLNYESNSLLMSWLVIGAGNALNCSTRKMYEDDQKVVPRMAILGESNIDANYHFAYSPTDAVELVDDQVEPMRTITAIPLTTVPDSSTDFWFYDPYNHQELSRHVESAKVVPLPSDLKEILKERAQTYPVLPDVNMKIKGTVANCSYPTRDPTNRGVVNRKSTARSNVRAPPIIEVQDDPVEVQVEDPVEVQDEPQLENVSDEESHVQVTVANDVDSGASTPGAAESAELASYDLRSRQTRGKMFLTEISSTSEKLSRQTTLISMYDNGDELRAIADYGVRPISNDFVMVAAAPNIMIDDFETIDRDEVMFSHAGLYIDNNGFIDHETVKDGCIFATNMQAHQAVRRYGKDATYKSLIEEIDGLLERKCFQGVLRSNLSTTQEKKRIRMSIFLKEKLDSKGNFQRLKSRLVAGGHLQLKDIFAPNEISSPTVSINSVFMLIALAVTQKKHFITFDIAQAYLNAEMPDEVYMTLDKLTTRLLVEIDPSYKAYVETNKNGNEEVTVKLNKALYGCVQSARLWYNTLSTYLKTVGFETNPVDQCVFNRRSEKGEQTSVCFHVDDGMATSTDLKDLKLFEQQLRSEYGEGLKITYGKSHEYLGMALNIKDSYCEMTMSKYIEDIVKDNGGFDQRIHHSPASDKLFTTIETKPLSEHDREHFHKTVARLLYLATRVRPDILLAVTYLCSRVTKATASDKVKLNRVIGYLAGTPELGKRLGGDENGEATLTSFSDASFAVHPNMKSHNGQYITLGLGGILIKCNKEKLVTRRGGVSVPI